MSTLLTSWRPFMVTLTRPAPDSPVTSALAASSCIFFIFSCMAWACCMRELISKSIIVSKFASDV